MTQAKLFPLRLPPNYHGMPKSLRRPSEINKELTQNRENPQFIHTKIGNWQLKRFDRDIETERREFLVHPAKISNDTPQWFKTTYHYFHKNNYNSITRRNVSHTQYDVTNRPKENPFANSQGFSSRVRREAPVSNKINMRDPTLTGTHWSTGKSQVAIKVGCVELRDYSIRKPQLKIGGNRPQNFINTYSVF